MTHPRTVCRRLHNIRRACLRGENPAVSRWQLRALLLVMLCAAVSGCQGSKADSNPPQADGAAAPDAEPTPVVKVEAQPIVRTSLDETIEVLGVAQPLHNRTARLTTAIEGRVAQILPSSAQEKERRFANCQGRERKYPDKLGRGRGTVHHPATGDRAARRQPRSGSRR